MTSVLLFWFFFCRTNFLFTFTTWVLNTATVSSHCNFSSSQDFHFLLLKDKSHSIMELFIFSRSMKTFAKHSFLVYAFIFPESGILDNSAFLFSFYNEWLQCQFGTFLYLQNVYFFRLKFAVLNSNTLLDVYFQLF